MLTKMVRTEKLLGLVALPELVHVRQVVYAAIPLGLRIVCELGAAVPARIVRRAAAGGLVRRSR